MKTGPAPDTTHTLSAALGLAPTVKRPSRAVVLTHRGVSLPMPGAHAALLRRLFSTAKTEGK